MKRWLNDAAIEITEAPEGENWVEVFEHDGKPNSYVVHVHHVTLMQRGGPNDGELDLQRGEAQDVEPRNTEH